MTVFLSVHPFTMLTFKLYVNVPLTNVLSTRRVNDLGRTDSRTIKLQAFTDFTFISGRLRNITSGTSCNKKLNDMFW